MMGEIVRRTVWFAIVACACAYAIFLVGGYFVRIRSAQPGAVIVYDAVAPGVHDLTGTITLSESCDDLFVRTNQTASSTYELIFEQWRDPAIPCTLVQTPRDFHAVVLAPSAGISFLATLDGASLPIRIESSVQQ